MSFLGGSAFRAVWGETTAYLSKSQDHKYEVERTDQQAKHDAEAHARNLAAIKLQSDLGVKVIEVQRDSALSQTEMDAWADAVKATSRPSGIAWIDGWNQSIRPAVATVAVVAMLVEIALVGSLTDWHKEVFSAALGIYLADRSLAKRGK